MDRHDYVTKIENEHLNNPQYYSKIGRGDTSLDIDNGKFHSQLRSLIKDKSIIDKLSSRGATRPYAYGLVKTHKIDMPTRLIISNIGSCTFKLAKFLVNILSPFQGKISSSGIKNNSDLISKIKSSPVTYPFKMVSFDVKSLFTNVSLNETLYYLDQYLPATIESYERKTVLNLIELCFNHSKFVFNGYTYQQKFGVSMGNALSPVIANLYMEFFETVLLPKILPPHIVWYRYIDDVLCFWPQNLDLDIFLTQMNTLNNNIQFTMEIEQNNCIPFLDVQLFRKDKDIRFSVYRKPTNVCSYLHFFSNHDLKTKKSVFISFFLRGFRVCDLEYINSEFEEIYNIGRSLQYPVWVLDDCRTAAFKTFSRTAPISNWRLNRHYDSSLILPYSTSFTPIRPILSSLGINLIFNYKNNIKNHLIQNKPKNLDANGVYLVPCGDCSQVYIGQTGKSISLRIKQHKYSVRTNQENNGISNHANKFQHSINWEGVQFIKHCNSFEERQVTESCLIAAANPLRIMNGHPGEFRTDPLLVEDVAPGLLGRVNDPTIVRCFI